MLLLPVLLLAAGAATDSCTPLDRTALAEEVAAAVRSALGLRAEEVRVEADAFRLRLRPGGQDSCLLNLHNLADEICATPVSDRPGVVQRFVTAARSACGQGRQAPST